jgi:integrase
MNDAINQGKMKRADYPFYAFKLKNEPTQRAFLSEKELEAIEKIKLQAPTSLSLTRDIYIFSAYAGGIRISDLLLMKWNNFDGERLNFKVSKTGRELNIKLPDSSLKILKKYHTKVSQPSDFIFPFLDNDLKVEDPRILYKAISSATALGNKNLKIIASGAKVNKSISFHTARHTFATRALRKGIRIEYVSRLLGHANIKETQVYAKIVNQELDKAMDVFNVVAKPKKPTTRKKNPIK